MNADGWNQVPARSKLPAVRANRGCGGRSLLEWIARRVCDRHGFERLVVVAENRTIGGLAV